MTRCHHCNEPVPAGEDRHVVIDGIAQPMCCAGCEAVAQLIIDADLQDFYRFRTATSARVDPTDNASHWKTYDDPAVLDCFASTGADGQREIRLQLEDIRCAACGWLIEQSLENVDGACDLQLNPVNGRVRLRWDADAIALSDLLAHLDRLGFHPHPLRPEEREHLSVSERHRYLKRIAIAGLGMMQVMMYAVAMYIGAIDPDSVHSGIGMDRNIWNFLRGVSLLIATPIVFYSAAPFFRGAWRDLQHRRAGMDVPVSLAIGSAYLASVWNTFAGEGHVYFDSVSMFVFFLLIGRYLEFTARHHVSAGNEALDASLPGTATVLSDENSSHPVALAQLKVGDVVLIRQGAVLPADGELLEPHATLDEALLTGESRAVDRKPGEQLLAGSLNRGSPLRMRVTRTGNDTLLSGITRLLERAQSARPRLARMADRIAQVFVSMLLVFAALTAAAWAWIEPASAFEVTLAVLVVTCPCALALAVPVALTAGTSAMASRGILAVNTDAFEMLPVITDVVFDKTGTLTIGKPHVTQTVMTGSFSEEHCLAIARGLESAASHPLAEAFPVGTETVSLKHIEQHVGAGMSGTHGNRRYRIGTPAFALQKADAPSSPAGLEGSWIVLADDDEALAWFEISDTLRPEALAGVSSLHARGLRVHLLSGDHDLAVSSVAAQLGIENHASRQRPERKLHAIRALQSEGRKVLMVGDGINDAPVLGAADVSIAMGQGAALAQAGADFVLTGGITAVHELLDHSIRTRRVIRQNLAWAIAYNLLALPLAATGLIAPWMAAIGMSLSSLLVTLNALRLRQVKAGSERNGHAGSSIAQALEGA